MATACMAAICADVAPVTLWNTDMFVWKSAAAVIAEVPIATCGWGTPTT